MSTTNEDVKKHPADLIKEYIESQMGRIDLEEQQVVKRYDNLSQAEKVEADYKHRWYAGYVTALADIEKFIAPLFKDRVTTV